jgi:pyridoxal phosphate enzyme (YggS family)
LPVNIDSYKKISEELASNNVTLVAVSKTKSTQEILELYNLGQRDFGENYVQELVEKHEKLPKDIRWHFIGHLQSNKVKLIAPFISMIHSVDSFKLLKEINKQALSNSRIIDCLLQVYIAKEETKFGLSEDEVKKILNEIDDTQILRNISIKGFMGMASFTDNLQVVKQEFKFLKSLYDQYSQSSHHSSFTILSMGMSADYELAIEEGSNMVRIGSLLFGKRN